MKKLNFRGFSHTLIPVAVVVIFGVAGVGYVVASHANSCHSSSTSTQNGHTTTVTQDGCGSACVQTVTVDGVAQPSTACNNTSCVVNGVPQPISQCPTPPTRTPVSTPTTVSGTVTNDGCVAATAPAGCTITITTGANKAYVVQIVAPGANGAKVWGKLYGFTANQDITGKRVIAKVYPSSDAVNPSQPGTYTLNNSSAYVRVI